MDPIGGLADDRDALRRGDVVAGAASGTVVPNLPSIWLNFRGRDGEPAARLSACGTPTAAPVGESALLRRERLYSSQLATWRAQRKHEGEAGLEPKPPGRKPLKDAKDRRIDQLEAEKAKLERKLLIAEKLLELQKKAQELLAAAQPAERP